MATLTSVDPNIRDHMTGVQLRLIREKLAAERDRPVSPASSRMSTGRIDENAVKLHQAMLRRQELMEKLKKEQQIRDDLHRPSSMLQGGSSPRQVVEHHVRPVRLDPLPQPPAPPPPTVIPVAQPMMMGNMNQNPSSTKQDLYDMMMMQNAQMHSMVMQQMMMSTIPKQPPPPPQPLRLSLDQEDMESLRSEKKRPKSVHHHHYTPPPPPQPPPHYNLPPLMPSYPYPSPRYYPVEVEPLKQPVARKKKTPKYVPPPFKYGELPFPGPWALRKFRHAAYAALFSKSVQKMIKLRKQGKAKKEVHVNLAEDFLFGIRLKEAVAALHHIYLAPDGKISGILRRVSGDTAKDLTVVLADNVPNKEKQEAYEDLAYIIENVAFEMTEIMPPSGVLGTHKKSVVYDMLQNGKHYPRGYLWQIEKNLLTFDYNSRIVNIGNNEAMYLLAGIFIGRALVTTLCLRPEEYGLTKTKPTYKAQQNLKLLSTLYIYLLRRVYSDPKSKQVVGAPFEIGKFLYKDDQMQTVYAKLRKSFEYGERLVRTWSSTYVDRLRNA